MPIATLEPLTVAPAGGAVMLMQDETGVGVGEAVNVGRMVGTGLGEGEDVGAMVGTGLGVGEDVGATVGTGLGVGVEVVFCT